MTPASSLPASSFPASSFPDRETLFARVAVTARNPFDIESIPFLSRLHEMAFRTSRGASKLFVAKPAKLLFRVLLTLGMGGTGWFRLMLPQGPRRISYNPRNTQFGALYQSHFQPLYEPEVSALLDLLVGDEDCFLDVGANWGWFALLIASRPDFRGQIHAFEPMPGTHADLSGVVREAGLEARIICHPLALSDHDGTSTMTVPGGVQSGLARLGGTAGVRARLARLDGLNLPAPAVIKMDVEDHEIEVLRGAGTTIAQARPFVVFENWSHPKRPEVTLDPLRWFLDREYCLFHATWAGETAAAGEDARGMLTVLTFPVEQRFDLPAQLNVLAAPRERLDELRRRLEA